MGGFVDLQVAFPESLEKAESLAFHLRKLGFKAVALTVQNGGKPENLEEVKEVFSRHRVEAALRVNLSPETSGRLLKDLRRLRGLFEIIGVICCNKQVARQAAKDHRVDLLLFPPGKLRLFDRAEVELASGSEAALELPLSSLLDVSGRQRLTYFWEAARASRLALERNIPVVLTSGAKDLYGLRAPRDLAAVGEAVYGLPSQAALASVSKVPWRILERNREKLSQDFVEVGVRLVRRNGDC